MIQRQSINLFTIFMLLLIASQPVLAQNSRGDSIRIQRKALKEELNKLEAKMKSTKVRKELADKKAEPAKTAYDKAVKDEEEKKNQLQAAQAKQRDVLKAMSEAQRKATELFEETTEVKKLKAAVEEAQKQMQKLETNIVKDLETRSDYQSVQKRKEKAETNIAEIRKNPTGKSTELRLASIELADATKLLRELERTALDKSPEFKKVSETYQNKNRELAQKLTEFRLKHLKEDPLVVAAHEDINAARKAVLEANKAYAAAKREVSKQKRTYAKAAYASKLYEQQLAKDQKKAESLKESIAALKDAY